MARGQTDKDCIFSMAEAANFVAKAWGEGQREVEVTVSRQASVTTMSCMLQRRFGRGPCRVKTVERGKETKVVRFTCPEMK